jgi:hypothetical protein
VIRIYQLHRRLADVEVLDGRLGVVSYVGNGLVGAVDEAVYS